MLKDTVANAFGGIAVATIASKPTGKYFGHCVALAVDILNFVGKL